MLGFYDFHNLYPSCWGENFVKATHLGRANGDQARDELLLEELECPSTLLKKVLYALASFPAANGDQACEELLLEELECPSTL